MPKLVSEISNGNSNERSVEGGQVADVSVRTWKILLNSPQEVYDVQQEIRVKIGDPHPNRPDVPCVSISERADGESRLVRVVTANYRTTPGESTSGKDPNSDPPDIRPAKFSITSSLIEVPAREWQEIIAMRVKVPKRDRGDFANAEIRGAPGLPEPPLNPAWDVYDGVTKLVPVININIEQYDNFPTRRLGEAGKVNIDEFKFGELTVAPFTCMLRGISVRPHVETFGSNFYRGFIRTFEFSIKTNGGWLIDQILMGFNIINQGLGMADTDQDALNLEHENYVVKEPRELAAGSLGKKRRAAVMFSAKEGGSVQRPTALPVALNRDGSPRNVETQDPKVLTQYYLTQDAIPFGNNFSAVGIRIREVI